jgi:hypothetical protein
MPRDGNFVVGQFSLSPPVHAFERLKWKRAEDEKPELARGNAMVRNLSEARAASGRKGGLAHSPAKMRELASRGGLATKSSARRRDVGRKALVD